MDVASLSSALDIVAPACGQTLSVAEKAAVETSLSVVKADNGFDTVVFWGRISGIAADYLIAQGYNLPYAMVDASSSPAVSFYRYRLPNRPSLCDAREERRRQSAYLAAVCVQHGWCQVGQDGRDR